MQVYLFVYFAVMTCVSRISALTVDDLSEPITVIHGMHLYYSAIRSVPSWEPRLDISQSEASQGEALK